MSLVFDKIKNLQNHPYFKQLHDVRSWALVAFAVMAVMITWSGIKSVQTNYGLQKQISRLHQENDIKKLENDNLKLKNEYLNTDYFLELAARRQFGKAAEGEQVVIVPKSVALAHTKSLSDKTDDKASDNNVEKPLYQKNFEAWMDFFLNRNDSN